MTRDPSTVVLVVDDDDAVQRVLAALLASRGYIVFEATDGEDAWLQLQSKNVDLIVTDPERIVHARGSGAHGYFECYKREASHLRARKRSAARVKKVMIVREGSGRHSARRLAG